MQNRHKAKSAYAKKMFKVWSFSLGCMVVDEQERIYKRKARKVKWLSSGLLDEFESFWSLADMTVLSNSGQIQDKDGKVNTDTPGI